MDNAIFIKKDNINNRGDSDRLNRDLITSLKQNIELLWFEAIKDELLFNNIDSDITMSNSRVLNQPVSGLINEIISLALKNKRGISYEANINTYNNPNAIYSVDDIFNISSIIANQTLRKSYSEIINCWRTSLLSGISFFHINEMKQIPFTSCLFNIQEHDLSNPTLFIYEESITLNEAINLGLIDDDYKNSLSRDITFDTIYNNETLLHSLDDKNYDVPVNGSHTIFRSSDGRLNRIKIKNKIVTGNVKVTYIFKKIIQDQPTTSLNKTFYIKETYVNDILVLKEKINSFPLIAIYNKNRGNIKHHFNWFQSLFREKRDVIRLLNQLSSKFASTIALDLNGSILIDKSVLLNKDMKSSDLKENIIEIDSSKTQNPDFKIQDYIQNLPITQLNPSHIEFYNLIIQELRSYCGLGMINGDVAQDSGVKFSMRLDRENQAINCLFTSLDNALLQFARNYIKNIVSISDEDILKMLPTYNGNILNVDEYKSALLLLIDQVTIQVKEDQFSDSRKTKLFSDFLKIKELSPESVNLSLEQLASLLNIDKDIIMQIKEFNEQNRGVDTGKLLENEVLESEAFYKKASAQEKIASAKSKIMDSQSKLKEVKIKATENR